MIREKKSGKILALPAARELRILGRVMKNCHILFLFAALGCATVVSAQDIFSRKTTTVANEAQRENARAELLLQQVERLAGQVDELRNNNAQLEQRLTQAEQRAVDAGPQQRAITALQNENTKLQTENAKLRDDVKTLRDEIGQVKAERETLRKQITDDIMARITKIIEAQNTRATPGRGTTTTPATSGNSATGGKETGRLHTVEAGQNLTDIAAAYKSSVDAIVKANNLKNPNVLRVGQELFIPD